MNELVLSESSPRCFHVDVHFPCAISNWFLVGELHSYS